MRFNHHGRCSRLLCFESQLFAARCDPLHLFKQLPFESIQCDDHAPDVDAIAGGSQSLAFWDVASVYVKRSKECGGDDTRVPGAAEDDDEGNGAGAAAAELEDSADCGSVSFEVEGKNGMVDEEPYVTYCAATYKICNITGRYMNLVQWLVVDEAGVGLKGAKITIGTRGGDASVIVAHLTTDKNGLATIRLPWAS